MTEVLLSELVVTSPPRVRVPVPVETVAPVRSRAPMASSKLFRSRIAPEARDTLEASAIWSDWASWTVPAALIDRSPGTAVAPVLSRSSVVAGSTVVVPEYVLDEVPVV